MPHTYQKTTVFLTICLLATALTAFNPEIFEFPYMPENGVIQPNANTIILPDNFPVKTENGITISTRQLMCFASNTEQDCYYHASISDKANINLEITEKSISKTMSKGTIGNITILPIISKKAVMETVENCETGKGSNQSETCTKSEERTGTEYTYGTATKDMTATAASKTESKEYLILVKTTSGATGSWATSLFDPDISTCPLTLNASTNYTMTANCTVSGVTAYSLAGADTVLDCQGHSITGTGGGTTYGVNINKQRFTMKNCIVQGTFTHGVYSFTGSANTTIKDSTITTERSSGNALYLRTGVYWLNNLTLNAAGGYAINLQLASGSVISNIDIVEYGGHPCLNGILMTVPSRVTLTNVTGEVGNYGINIGGDGHKLNNITLLNTGGYGLTSATTNSVFNNMNITADAGSDTITFITGTTGNNISNSIFGSGTVNNGNGYGIWNNGFNNAFTNITAFGVSGGLGDSLTEGTVLNNATISSNTQPGAYIGVSTGTNISNSRFISNSSYGLWVQETSNIAVINTTIQSTSNIAAYISQTSLSNQFINNTISSSTGADLKLIESSSNNTFCLNNFTGTPDLYVNDSTGGNYFNCTYDGKNQGNIWANVINGSVEITGNGTNSSIAGYQIGNNGAGFPYNSSTSGGKFYCDPAVDCGTAQDYAPLFIYSEPPAPTNSCAYSGTGNWTINLSDNCNITSSANLGANYLIYNGTGTVSYNNSSSTIVISAKGETLTNIVGSFYENILSMIWKNYTN